MTWRITSKFMEQEAFRNHKHLGLDFATPNNTELRSLKDGVVEKIVNYGDANIGKGVFIKFNDGKTAIYGHLSRFSNIKVGDKVSAGDLIGYSGNSGHCVGKNGGYHLHFAIKEGERFLDPSPYINLIQEMDNPTLLAKMSNSIQPVPTSDNLFTIGNILKQQTNVYSDLLQLFKSNFILLLTDAKLHIISVITDYSIFSQYLKYILQFLS